jgi:hypothetical protein
MKSFRYFFAAIVWTFAATAFRAEPLPRTIAADSLPAATEQPSAVQSPLMGTLSNAGLSGFFTRSGLNLYGYIEAGYMHDATAQGSNDGPTFIGFNSFKNDVILDKISLNLERTVDPTTNKFDIGFHLEEIYGADAAFIHANGLGDAQHGREQKDLLQAYIDIAFPGLPVKIRLGKWIELAGFEHFSANIYGAFGDPARAQYSYSYQFLYAEPGTQTGVLATWIVNPQWTIDAGFTRGWNQSLKDANSSLDFLGRVTFTPSDKTALIFVMTEGPEFPTGFGTNLSPGDNTNSWTALDLVATQKFTDNLSFGLGFDYVSAPQIPALTSGSKQWGGAAAYLSYAMSRVFTINTRLEWYSDAADGYSLGAPSSTNFYEATLSFAVKPFPTESTLSHLLFRPEIRYDLSDQPVFGTGDKNQFTINMDALFTF